MNQYHAELGHVEKGYTQSGVQHVDGCQRPLDQRLEGVIPESGPPHSAQTQSSFQPSSSPTNRNQPRRVDHTYRNYSNFPLNQLPVVRKTTSKNFPSKLHQILSTPGYEHIISWMPHGRAWKVHNKDLLVAEVIPMYFAQSKFESFARQLNGWGFLRLYQSGNDYNAYYHACFLRGLPHLTLLMDRVRPNKGKLLPYVEGEPNFYIIEKEYPLPPRAPAMPYGQCHFPQYHMPMPSTTTYGDGAHPYHMPSSAVCGAPPEPSVGAPPEVGYGHHYYSYPHNNVRPHYGHRHHIDPHVTAAYLSQSGGCPPFSNHAPTQYSQAPHQYHPPPQCPYTSVPMDPQEDMRPNMKDEVEADVLENVSLIWQNQNMPHRNQSGSENGLIKER